MSIGEAIVAVAVLAFLSFVLFPEAIILMVMLRWIRKTAQALPEQERERWIKEKFQELGHGLSED